jgi:hypothetical protein
MSEIAVDDPGVPVPTEFSLSVLMQRSPSDSPWQDERWEVVGVTATRGERSASPGTVTLVHEQGEIRQYRHSGFRLRLHVDECESYYHNLRAPVPRCFVIAGEDGEGRPVPFLVSLSFDEANAYQESDGVVYVVAMPPELYRWCELFVLDHYVPEKKKKRRLTDWRKASDAPAIKAPRHE